MKPTWGLVAAMACSVAAAGETVTPRMAAVYGKYRDAAAEVAANKIGKVAETVRSGIPSITDAAELIKAKRTLQSLEHIVSELRRGTATWFDAPLEWPLNQDEYGVLKANVQHPVVVMEVLDRETMLMRLSPDANILSRKGGPAGGGEFFVLTGVSTSGLKPADTMNLSGAYWGLGKSADGWPQMMPFDVDDARAILKLPPATVDTP